MVKEGVGKEKSKKYGLSVKNKSSSSRKKRKIKPLLSYKRLGPPTGRKGESPENVLPRAARRSWTSVLAFGNAWRGHHDFLAAKSREKFFWQTGLG